MKRLPLVLFVLLVLASPAGGGGNVSGGYPVVFMHDHLCPFATPGGQMVPGDCGRGEIALIQPDGSGLGILTHDKVSESSPRWSPDRREIAFFRPRQKPPVTAQIWLMAADGTHQRALTRLHRIQLFATDVEAQDLDWAPNGRAILFSADPASPPSKGVPEQLYLANARSGAVTRLTWTPSSDSGPAWSPNGRWIVFTRDPAAHRPLPSQIFRLSTSNHRLQQLTYGKVYSSGQAGWSPDSRHIVFSDGRGLLVMNADGSHVRSLKVWGMTPSWSADGRWIVFSTDDGLERVRPDGSGRQVITHVRSQWWEDAATDW